MSYKRLWIGFVLVVGISFAVLGYYGAEIYREAPPIPEQVETSEGALLFSGEGIKDGQNVWQSMGGQEVGSIWGHGAYDAPDWSADWLHREAVYILNVWSQEDFSKPFDKLGVEQQAALKARLQEELRANTYDAVTGTLVVSPVRAAAIAEISEHYAGLFIDDPAFADLREAYAIPANTIEDPECPGQEITYTNNWPAEELVGNRPSSSFIIWTGVSVILLLAGIGLLAWYYAANQEEEIDHA